jgi:hypothetical protein
VQEELLEMLRARTDVGLSVQEAAGHRLVRVRALKGMQAPPFPRSRHYREPEPRVVDAEPAPTTAPVPASRRPRSRARRIGVDLLPPIVTRAVRRALANRP